MGLEQNGHIQQDILVIQSNVDGNPQSWVSINDLAEEIKGNVLAMLKNAQDEIGEEPQTISHPKNPNLTASVHTQQDLGAHATIVTLIPQPATVG